MAKSEKLNELINSVEKVFVGKRETVELALNAMFSGGHLLVNDLPGVGKTTLAKAIARSVGGATKRVQFTPDLLPTDITGVNIYIHEKNEFRFHPGPVFANILLADEINRATPRAQSSLLEAMEEFQVSVDGTIHKLPMPFMVIATQNPVEIQGTFPLPEAQLDRFLISLSIGYPTTGEELKILDSRSGEDPLDNVDAVLTLDEVKELKQIVRTIRVDDSIKDYIVRISEATRDRDDILIGASPRASLALMMASRTKALFDGKEYVTPEDIKAIAPYVLGHRLILRHAARLDLEKNRNVVRVILDEVAAPRPK